MRRAAVLTSVALALTVEVHDALRPAHASVWLRR